MAIALVLAAGLLLTAMVPAAWGFKVLTNQKGGKLGGYQTLVARNKGHIVLGLGVIHHGGGYRLCVDDPGGNSVCHHLSLKFAPSSGAFLSFIYWSKRFPVNGKGTYKASWFKSGTQLGPKLAFIR